LVLLLAAVFLCLIACRVLLLRVNYANDVVQRYGIVAVVRWLTRSVFLCLPPWTIACRFGVTGRSSSVFIWGTPTVEGDECRIVFYCGGE
jgi:hypothetical protein